MRLTLPVDFTTFVHLRCARDFALLSQDVVPLQPSYDVFILRRVGQMWTIRWRGVPGDSSIDMYLGIYSDDCRALGLDKALMPCRIPRGSKAELSPITAVGASSVTLPDGRVVPVAPDAFFEDFDGKFLQGINEFRAAYTTWMAGVPDPYNLQRNVVLWVKDGVMTAANLGGTVDETAIG